MEYAIVVVFTLAMGLLVLYLRTLVKSSVAESVKHEFEFQRQQAHEDFLREQNALERHDRFRLAALDERVRTHQRAFALALVMTRKIRGSVNDHIHVNKECEEFWQSHALYLTDEARGAFRDAIQQFNMYSMLFNAWNQDRKNAECTKNLEHAFDTVQGLPGKLISIVDREASSDHSYLRDSSVSAFEDSSGETAGAQPLDSQGRYSPRLARCHLGPKTTLGSRQMTLKATLACLLLSTLDACRALAGPTGLS